MMNEPATLQPAGLELASFGEILYAFSALRSSGRRRSPRVASEMLPWGDTIPGTSAECRIPQAPPRAALPVRPRMESVSHAHTPKARRTPGRCTCGQCRTCQENARWERIFQEKFANADYYHHDIRIRYASPLSSV